MTGSLRSDFSRLPAPLLDRYIAGEATPAEIAQVEVWIAAYPEGRVVLETLRRGDDAERAAALHATLERRWEALTRRMHEWLEPSKNRLSLGSSVPARERSARPAWQGIGGWGTRTLHRTVWYAMLSLVIGVLGVVVGWNGRAHHVAWRASTEVSTYATANGERANITLPDGSTVVLDVASRLDVPVNYAAGNHTVHLVGEALFTVTRHERTPFRVIADGMTAQVLGTSFAVRHYNTDTTATVAVRDGKVAVGSAVVTAARLIEVGRHGVVRVGTADASQFSFATGVLTITSLPLSRAVTELDRWYGADIRVGDPSLARVPIEGKFTAGSLSDLTSILELMLNVRVVRDGRVLTLYPKAR